MIRNSFNIVDYVVEDLLRHAGLGLIHFYDVMGWLQEYVNFGYRENKDVPWTSITQNIDVLDRDKLDVELECFCNLLSSLDEAAVKDIIKDSLFLAKREAREQLIAEVGWGVAQLQELGAEAKWLLIHVSWVHLMGLEFGGLRLDPLRDVPRVPILLSSPQTGRFVLLRSKDVVAF